MDLQVEKLMHILEREIDNTQQAQQWQFDDQVHLHNIEGLERSKDGLHTKLTNYLGLQCDCIKNKPRGKC
jgi:hypothetical protein